MNNTKFSQTSFGKSSAQMGTFFRHWVIECICVSLLYYIIGEAIYIISRAITSKLYGVYDSSTVDHRVINCFIFIYTGLDYKLPFIKEFIIPYTTSYAFWVVGPFLVYGFMGREKFYQFMLASVAVNLFSLFVFITIPNGIKQDFRPAPSV